MMIHLIQDRISVKLESSEPFQELLIKQSYKVKIDNIKWEFLTSPWDFLTNKFVVGSNILVCQPPVTSTPYTLIVKYCPTVPNSLPTLVKNIFKSQNDFRFTIPSAVLIKTNPISQSERKVLSIYTRNSETE